MQTDPRVMSIPAPAETGSWDLHRHLRVMKGRPATRTTHTQFIVRDGKTRGSVKTLNPDPILDLFTARKNATCRWLSAEQRAYANLRYGELRQTVVSPVMLPADVAEAFRPDLEDVA